MQELNPAVAKKILEQQLRVDAWWESFRARLPRELKFDFPNLDLLTLVADLVGVPDTIEDEDAQYEPSWDGWPVYSYLRDWVYEVWDFDVVSGKISVDEYLGFLLKEAEEWRRNAQKSPSTCSTDFQDVDT